MAYTIGSTEFRRKEDIENRCREILHSVPDGNLISGHDHSFLVDLFQYHDEWKEKTKGCLIGITTGISASGTRCFYIIREDKTCIDISFKHSVKKIPTRRLRKRLPQYLVDYKNAARTAVIEQISSFRRHALASNACCPISHIPLSAENSEVDHTAPLTFDRLLHDFTKKHEIDPSNVSVGSVDGTIARFDNDTLSDIWASYHKEHACLRLISKSEHKKLAPQKIDWDSI